MDRKEKEIWVKAYIMGRLNEKAINSNIVEGDGFLEKHELEDYQIVELSGIEVMPLHDLVYSVEVLTPYAFILKNISTNDTVDFTRFNHVGQGGTVTTLKALEFEGGVSNSATTTLSMVGPTKSRNII